jgi:hypothetical protein
VIATKDETTDTPYIFNVTEKQVAKVDQGQNHRLFGCSFLRDKIWAAQKNEESGINKMGYFDQYGEFIDKCNSEYNFEVFEDYNFQIHSDVATKGEKFLQFAKKKNEGGVKVTHN